MKKWIIGFIIIIVLIGVVYLDKKGLLGWQTISIIVAAIAAPFKFLMGIFANKVEEIKKKHDEIRQQEAGYQAEIESKIQEREQRISNLTKELDILDSRIDVLKKQRELIDSEVEKMSLKELQEAGRKYFGTK
jgi:septal ring factor EnvC (AmiA/AmiB activator)